MMCQPKSKGGLGLRHVTNTNIAFMAKVGWGLIHKKDELQVKVIRAKRNTIPMIHAQRNCSNVWKGIKKAWPLVEKGTTWNIGKGYTNKVLGG